MAHMTLTFDLAAQKWGCQVQRVMENISSKLEVDIRDVDPGGLGS